MYTLLNIIFFSEMVLCDAFHTNYTKHLRRRNYYLVYQRIEIISTNAYFQNSHNTCRYLYSRVPILWDAFNRVCMQFLLYYTHDHYTCGCGTRKDIYFQIASLQCNNTRQEVGLGLGGITLFLGILGSGKHRNNWVWKCGILIQHTCAVMSQACASLMPLACL